MIRAADSSRREADPRICLALLYALFFKRKYRMKTPLILNIHILSAAALSSVAFGQGGIITGNTYTSPAGYGFQVTQTRFCKDAPNSFESGEDTLEMSCQAKKGIQAGLKATGIALGIASAVCTIAPVPIPVPAKVTLVGSTLLVGVADFVVNFIPCQDRQDKRKQAVQFCAMLQAQGFACDVNKIKIEDL